MMRTKTKQTARKRKLLRRILVGTGVLLAVGLVDYFVYPYGTLTTGPVANRGENGLWLRYTWYFGEKSDAETVELARNLVKREISTAYFHVRSITKSGALKYRYPEAARKLTKTLHREAPGVKLVAWIYAGNSRGEGEVVLTDPAVRRKMVEEAVWLVKECGFDGMQWDYEICNDGEPGFLPLLQETRKALPSGALLSVAAPIWLPFPLGRFGWSEEYFAEVAGACDELCVMCYDSGFWLPRGYAWLVHQQAVRVSRAVASGNIKCRLLLGVPTYGPGFFSHNPRAENIAIALKGAREGMADAGADRRVLAGVALFAEYTTDEDEWRTYERLWLGKATPQSTTPPD
jgi:hypothetical protein